MCVSNGTPDHDAYGNKIQRRAIQIGMKDESLEKFGKRFIRSIEDITDFVKEQKELVDRKELDKLIIPRERIIKLNRTDLNIGLTEKNNNERPETYQ